MALPPLPEGFELEGSVPAPPGGFVVGYKPPPKPLTNDNPNVIDDFLIGKLSKAPGLGNAPDIQGSIPGRIIQGAAELPLGALQLGARMSTAALIPGVTNSIDEKIKEINARTEQLRGPNAGFDWARLTGAMATPVAALSAAKIPLAATYAGKVGQGVGIGAVAGATAPVTDGGENFATEKATQIAGGAALGGVIPAAAPLVTGPAKAAYRGLIEPWANPAAIKGRAFLEAAGDKTDDIIRLLRGNKELVPGARPTAGEAAAPAGSAEFSALQRQAQDIAPTPYTARADEQNAARLASLRTVGQDEAALRAAEGARKAAADPLYDAARAPGNIADPIGVKRSIDDLLARNPGNRELVTELTNIKKGLLNDQGGVRVNAEQVSSVIDGLKAAKADVKNKFIAGHLNTLQKDLEKAIPGYEQANKTFATMSEPVNQMRVGQYLEKKLVPALSDEAKQKASTFAEARRDAPGTIKRATGAPRYESLEKILTPQQMAVVNGIGDDLARGARFTDLAKAGTQAAPDIRGGMGNQKLPNLLNRHVMLANAVIGRLEGKVNAKLAAEIAAEMLNPPAVAETLAKAQARAQSNKAMATMVQKAIQAGTAAGVSAGSRQ